ncbi:MAG TPA: SCO family protein [Solirubrobacteraceae bacterium]|nr:SCO family protein [Solirubrobacteraceae bacterium]
MTTRVRAQRILMVTLAALLVAIVVVLATGRGGGATPAPVSHSRFEGTTMPAGLRAYDFSLRNVNGRRVDLAAQRGHVVVLTFIHSLCHDTCPFMVEQIKGALNLLPHGGAGVPVIGVSADPAEDTVAHRRAFLAQHEMTGRMAFLNGSMAQMRPIWHRYAVLPVSPKVDHSTFVILIDKRGYERVGDPPDALTPESLAHDIRVLEREPA